LRVKVAAKVARTIHLHACCVHQYILDITGKVSPAIARFGWQPDRMARDVIDALDDGYCLY